jgi:hypothetical protein
MLPYKTRGKTGRTSKSSCNKVASEFFATNTPDPPHWTLNYRFASFSTIWVHLGPLCCLTKLGAKRAELVQKFVPRSCIGVFRDEHTRSTPLDPKLSFCCISYYLGAFGTVWLPHETRCKTGRTSVKVCATKLHRNFSQRTHPIHPIRPSTNVLVRFIPFGCIWDRLVALRYSVQNGLN